MTDAQFQEIKALLEKLLEAAQVTAALSQLFLDQHKAQAAAATQAPPAKPPDPPAA